MEPGTSLQVVVSARTDVGRVRDANEDAFSITELQSGFAIDAFDADRAVDVGQRGLLLALSDGMGGHQAGEVASALVVEVLQAELQRAEDGPIVHLFEEAVRRANGAVHAAAQRADRRGMGATLVAVFIRGTQAYIAEVGDSRAYLLRGGRLRQITRDQSMVQLLVDQGIMTAREARNAPGRNVILQAMGLLPDVRVAIGRLELRRTDRLLLCSDGVTNALTDDELRGILTESSPREACETMIALANERGGHDNETVIVADVHGQALVAPPEFETVTSTYEVLQAFHPAKRPPGIPAYLPPSDSVPELVDEDLEPEIHVLDGDRQQWIDTLRSRK
ncbi:MAG TPA: PP2C family serine/threonine-protein phosphatase [Kofleriaceae bacterium]|nr:PP2C family serine/threonine-protein phosphatase [Kofleriaceae bacterium]